MTPLVDVVTGASAIATATAAAGCFREAWRLRTTITANARRSNAADVRSRGNRRALRWLLPRVLDGSEHRQPSTFDPDPEPMRTDGGDHDDA